MKNKKGQLKIQEMAFMLVAVVLFFILAGLFAISIVYKNLYDEANRIAEEKTLSAVTSLSDTPELSCVSTKSNCVDSDKLLSLLNKSVYRNYWPFSSLRVVRFDGFGKEYSEMVSCNEATYPDCNLFVVYDREVKNEREISSFVALCRKEYENYEAYDRCEVAKLVAGTEIREEGEG